MSGHSRPLPGEQHQPGHTTPARIIPGQRVRHHAPATHRFCFPLIAFAIHTLLVQIAAIVAYRSMPHSTTYNGARTRAGMTTTLDGFWETIVTPPNRWDGLWYTASSRSGYRYTTITPIERFGSTEDTLWPLLSWMMRAGAAITGLPPEAAGYILVNGSFAGALIALYTLMIGEFGETIARRALWCIALLPGAFFYHALSTEAPFLFLAAIAFLVEKREQWLLAGLFTLLAALLRSHGVLLIVPLLVLAIEQVRGDRRRLAPGMGWLLLPLIGPLVTFWFWTERGLSWATVKRAHFGAFRRDDAPWSAIACAIRQCPAPTSSPAPVFRSVIPAPGWNWALQLLHDPSWGLISSPAWRRQFSVSTSLDLVVGSACLLLALVGLVRLPLWMGVYLLTLLSVVWLRMPPDAPFFGMTRFALILFPLAIVLATLLDDAITRWLAGIAGVLVLALLTAQFANAYWVS